MAKVVLRKPYSLINSEFNDFLFAPIGDEGNGMTLSVLSAFARLDIDPWREAARLSELSKEKAAQALAPIIARLPDGNWAPADTREIAARLVGFLPQRVAVPAGAVAAVGAGRPRSQVVIVVISLIFSAAAWFVIGMHHPSPPSTGSALSSISMPDARP